MSNCCEPFSNLSSIGRVVVSLRDGRKLFGVLRSFDQFGTSTPGFLFFFSSSSSSFILANANTSPSLANLVLQDTTERIYLNPTTFGETYKGVYIVRGENVVFLGELDPDREEFLEDHVVESTLEEAKVDENIVISNTFGIVKQSSQQQQPPQQPLQQQIVLRKIPFEDAERIFKERIKDSKKVLQNRLKNLDSGEGKYENHLY